MTHFDDEPPDYWPTDEELADYGYIRTSKRVRSIKSTPRVSQCLWVDFAHDAYAPEFVREHPCVVVRAAQKLDHDTCIIVPLTTSEQKQAPHNHKLAKNPNPRDDREVWAVCDHLYTVNLARLRSFARRKPIGARRASRLRVHAVWALASLLLRVGTIARGPLSVIQLTFATALGAARFRRRRIVGFARLRDAGKRCALLERELLLFVHGRLRRRPHARPSLRPLRRYSHYDSGVSAENSCPLVMIEWEDSAQPVSAWTHLRSFEPGGVVRVASVGWLIHDGEDLKALAPNLGGLDGACSAQVSGVIRIPARCVVRIVRLREPTLASGRQADAPSSRPVREPKRQASRSQRG